MRIWSVEVAQSRTRRIKVPAASPDLARAAVTGVLRQGDRVLSVTDTDTTGTADADDARDALAHICARDFLPYASRAQCVEDWLIRGLDPEQRAAVNTALAFAGLRVVSDTTIAVGSPTSIPALQAWCNGTHWHRTRFFELMGRIPGATRAGITFAGVRSRAIVLPIEAFGLGDLGQADEVAA